MDNGKTFTGRYDSAGRPIHVERKGSSAIETVEQSPTQGVAAVATGSLPVSSAMLLAMADREEERGKKCLTHEYNCRESGDTAMAQRWFDRHCIYDAHARNLRRLVADANKRQPEENHTICRTPKYK